MNLPNQLTVARCIMALIFVVLMSFQSIACYVVAYLFFTAAAITDYYDGHIARSRGLVTNFGKLLDPVADKVLMVSAFIMMMTIDSLKIPGWAIVVILAREFLVTGARSLAASQGNIIAANSFGKAKTVFQMVYVFAFLFFALVLEVLNQFESVRTAIPGDLALYETIIGHASLVGIILVAVYTVYSGIQFIRVNWKTLGLDNLS